MNQQTKDAIGRVEAFLDYRATMGGPIDHATIHTLGHGDGELSLTTADLRQLLAADYLEQGCS